MTFINDGKAKLALLKKKYSMTFINDGKATFFQEHHRKNRDHWSELLQRGRKIRLISDYSIGKWEFVAKEHGWRE